MEPALMRSIAVWGLAFLQLLLPILLMFHPWKAERIQFTFKKVVFATCVAWAVLFVYQVVVLVPVNFAYDESNGYPTDRTGYNVAVLMTGWLLPSIVSLLTLAVGRLYLRLRRKTHLPHANSPH